MKGPRPNPRRLPDEALESFEAFRPKFLCCSKACLSSFPRRYSAACRSNSPGVWVPLSDPLSGEPTGCSSPNILSRHYLDTAATGAPLAVGASPDPGREGHTRNRGEAFAILVPAPWPAFRVSPGCYSKKRPGFAGDLGSGTGNRGGREPSDQRHGCLATSGTRRAALQAYRRRGLSYILFLVRIPIS